MNRISSVVPLLTFIAFLTACSPTPPSANFPVGKWGILRNGQVVSVFTFNPDHTLTDPHNNPGTWALDGTDLSVDVKITTKTEPPAFVPDTSTPQPPNFLSNVAPATPIPTPSPIPTPEYQTVTKHEDITIVSKTPDTVTITDISGHARTFKFLPAVSQ